MITRLPILDGEAVRLILMESRRTKEHGSGSVYSRDEMQPISIALKGTYNDYGGIESFTDDCEKLTFAKLQKNFGSILAEGKSPENLTEFIDGIERHELKLTQTDSKNYYYPQKELDNNTYHYAMIKESVFQDIQKGMKLTSYMRNIIKEYKKRISKKGILEKRNKYLAMTTDGGETMRRNKVKILLDFIDDAMDSTLKPYTQISGNWLAGIPADRAIEMIKLNWFLNNNRIKYGTNCGEGSQHITDYSHKIFLETYARELKHLSRRRY